MSPRFQYRDVSPFPSVKPSSQVEAIFAISFNQLSRDVLSSFPPDFPPIPRNRGFRFPPRSVCVIPSETAVPGDTSTNTPDGTAVKVASNIIPAFTREW